jgi:hypothetical protein
VIEEKHLSEIPNCPTDKKYDYIPFYNENQNPHVFNM